MKIDIEEIKRKILPILQRYGVKRVGLFGSCVRGEMREDSDIDIIIVSETFRYKDIFEKVKLTRGIHRELVKKIKKPFDIMYYSDEEWDQNYSLIINAAKKEGEIIYG